MAKPNFTQKEIDSFMETLTKWGRTLSKKEQELLAFVTNQAEKSGELSSESLDKVAGGRARIADPDFWAQWSARQY